MRAFAVLLPLIACLASPAAARSKAAEYLVREEIADACESGQGSIDSAAVIERDLTGDGKADLVIAHEGIACVGGTTVRSLYCGMQVCDVKIYVRRGPLLKLEAEILGGGVRVESGRIPAIHMYAHGGKQGSIRWNGNGFR